MGLVLIETWIAAPVDMVFDLARDIDVHQRTMVATGERALAGRISGQIELGETVTWQARHFGIEFRLSSRVTAMERPHVFVDEQVAGPFAEFRHEHRFAADAGGTRMVDRWRHRSPFGLLGRVVDWLVLDRYMRRQLLGRSARLKAEAERVAADPQSAASAAAL
jgi:ligand-binding SRPBCC domain-containing protein